MGLGNLEVYSIANFTQIVKECQGKNPLKRRMDQINWNLNVILKTHIPATNSVKHKTDFEYVVW